ncbi:multidrug efflux SMR transporter [Lactobacillus sp. Sy-1]|uniref:DMT family transporter n=1 Tax=Lactobacillus sp. Sy-1 TaxID=2109645 RepID=UPI001C5A0DCD|nr:multidrug efflux SMR transporter [Lactobacillus sp. Sy-1]
MYYYLFLFLAIVGEMIGTNLLKASMGFSRWLPALGAIVSFSLCFYFLSIAMIKIPLNVAYATWSGVGLILATIVSVLIWKDQITLITVLGLTLIIAGVVILNLFEPK